MRKAIDSLLRLAGTLVLLFALVGAGSCGLMSAQGAGFGGKVLALVFLGACVILVLLIKIIWTKTPGQ